MRRYALFAAQFVLAPMISGPFVVSTTGRASWLEWAHVVSGIAAIYIILFLLLKAARNRQIRLQAGVALALGLLEAVPGAPRLHAAVSPLLFTSLAWAVMSLNSEENEPHRSRWIFAAPAVVLLPICYGVGYRHQTSGFLPHIGAAVLVGGFLVMFSAVVKEHHPDEARLGRACNLTITAVLLQMALGISAFVIRLLEIENGLLLTVVRTLHITGAAPVLAATTELAIQYRRGSRAIH